MEFKAKIYIKDESLPFYKRWTLTEQVFFGNFFILIIIYLSSKIFKFEIDLNTNVYLK